MKTTINEKPVLARNRKRAEMKFLSMLEHTFGNHEWGSMMLSDGKRWSVAMSNNQYLDTLALRFAQGSASLSVEARASKQVEVLDWLDWIDRLDWLDLWTY